MKRKINIQTETDIGQLRDYCRDLEEQCHVLQNLILINNISPLEDLTTKCITENRSYLKQISQQIQYMDYSNDACEQIEKLINYYKHMQLELQKFL